MKLACAQSSGKGGDVNGPQSCTVQGSVDRATFGFEGCEDGGGGGVEAKGQCGGNGGRASGSNTQTEVGRKAT
eukprot:COSAG05_NODE_331_length_11273_cov_3.896635_9_plen_73_part_00